MGDGKTCNPGEREGRGGEEGKRERERKGEGEGEGEGEREREREERERVFQHPYFSFQISMPT